MGKRKETSKTSVNKDNQIVSWKHPWGKFLRLGPETCTDSELLAILIGTGVPGKTAEQIASELLKTYQSFRGLANLPLERLMEIKGLKIDCEYNLHGMDMKLLDGLAQKPECEEDRKTDRIYPDIIVHIRNTDEVNDLVIEMKTRNGSTTCDETKLQLLTGPQHQFRYRLGLLLEFNKITKPKLTWYKNGQIEN